VQAFSQGMVGGDLPPGRRLRVWAGAAANPHRLALAGSGAPGPRSLCCARGPARSRSAAAETRIMTRMVWLSWALAASIRGLRRLQPQCPSLPTRVLGRR
jgi:hypothetical protein